MVLNLMLIGLAIALDPLPLTAFMVILPSRRGVRKGAAFVFGWLMSLAIVVTVTVLATGNNPPKPNTAPSLAPLAVKLAIGTFLVWIAIRQRRRMRGRRSRRSHRSGRSTWTTCPRGSPWPEPPSPKSSRQTDQPGDTLSTKPRPVTTRRGFCCPAIPTVSDASMDTLTVSQHRATAASSWPGKVHRTSRLRTASVTRL